MTSKRRFFNFRRRKKKPKVEYCRPSLALTDYEISDTRTSAMSSLLLLFALLEGMCGLVLPICHAFSRPESGKKKHYYQVFLTLQYCLSMFALFYLQSLCFYYDRKRNKMIERRQQLISPSQTEYDSVELEEVKQPRVTFDDKKDEKYLPLDTVVCLENSRTNSVKPSSQYPSIKLPRMPVGEHHRFNQRLLSETSEDDYPLSPTSPPTTPSPINGSPLSSGGGDQSATNLAPGPLELFFGDDHTIKGERISRQSEGVSLYLRLGAVGFGFGVMIFDGFKLAEPWEGPTVSSCHDVFWIPNHVIHFIYVFWQTYFLFKHHQLVYNVQKFVVRFLLCHLAIANLCQWLKTIVEEISSESEKAESAPHSSAHSPMHFTIATVSPMDVGLHEANLTHGLHSNHTAKRMAPYLFPCVIEYSLIALAMFYKMFQKVGHVHEESERMERMRQAKSLGRNYTECHRAHKGLFIGLLFFMATLVAMCLFFIFIEDHGKRQLALLVYQSTELTLIAMAILISLACLVKLRKLKFSQLSEEGAFDDNLLLVGLMGMLFYDLFLLIPTFDPPTDPDQRRVAQLFTAKAVLEIVQSLFQVYLILEATRRCAGSLLDVRNKPGRTLVTLLLILNLAMWVVNTFEVKRADSHGLQKTFYSEIAWRIITNIALPLIVFFRFHSTVCLADVWANAYRFHERAK